MTVTGCKTSSTDLRRFRVCIFNFRYRLAAALYIFTEICLFEMRSFNFFQIIRYMHSEPYVCSAYNLFCIVGTPICMVNQLKPP